MVKNLGREMFGCWIIVTASETCLKNFEKRVDRSTGGKNGDYKQNKHRPQKGHYNKGSTQPSRYNILSFGAVGDGISDDSKAVLAAWKEACEVYGATIEIPAGYSFVLRPLTLQGPCMPHLVLQINGTLLAPPNPYSWSKSSLYQ